jgi:transketolase
MIGVAIGLSCRNKIPFCSSFGAFLMRAVDQIRIAGIGGNTIKIVGSHAGCSIG